MGIRFECPNGHRLHVKSFLAGRRAKCPYCNAKVQVPDVSTPRATGSGPLHDVSEECSAPAGPPSVFTPLPSASFPLPSATQTRRPEPEAGPPPSEEPAWFVRPPGGGQFGPAAPWLLEQWREEGRIPDDALIWQEDWPEWRRAGDVWETVLPPVATVIDAKLPLHREDAPSIPRRSRKKDHTVLAIAVLSAASLILLVVLLWILNRTS